MLEFNVYINLKCADKRQISVYDFNMDNRQSCLILKYVAWQVLLIFNFLYLFITRFFLERFEYKINPRVLAESE